MTVSDWFTNEKRVRIALALKNIDYKYIAVNLLKAEQLDSEYTGKPSALILEKNSGPSPRAFIGKKSIAQHCINLYYNICI